MVRTYLNKRKNAVASDAVIQGAVKTVQEMRLAVRFGASRYGMTQTALYYRI